MCILKWCDVQVQKLCLYKMVLHIYIYIYNIRYIAWFYMFRWFSPGIPGFCRCQISPSDQSAIRSNSILSMKHGGSYGGVGPSTFHHMPRIDPKDKLHVHNAKWHSSKSAKKSCGSSHLIGIVYHCLSQISSPPIPSPNCCAC